MEKCKCYEEISYCLTSLPPIYRTEARCMGTKERDICSCGGDPSKCDFYPEIRERAKKEIELTAYRKYIHDNNNESSVLVTQEKIEKTKSYLFIFSDDSACEIKFAGTFKDAIHQMADHTNNGSELMYKAFKGFDANDIPGLVSIFEYLNPMEIKLKDVYIIDEKIYSAE